MAQALMTGMEENARQNPNKQLHILRALEDGDFVAVHSRVRQNPGDRGVVSSVSRGDRIAELWDIGQPVRAESVNANGMF
jgi:predicted SnoaL-like aldol condensation-catalyzing enzyme